MSAAVGDRIVAFARVVSAVGGDAADLLVLRDLTEKIGQNGRITDVAPGDFDGPDLQRFFIDPKEELAPDAPFRGSDAGGGRILR